MPSDASAGALSQARQRTLPLFYSQVRPVDPAVHAGLSLPDSPNFSFAANTNTVPLNGPEFAFAQRNYPIVFARPPEAVVALALLGLQRDSNLFVDEPTGRWAPYAYVPGYVRRFPFVFIEAQERRFALAVEQSFLVKGGKRPLFDQESKPTALLQGALNFCGSYQKGYQDTQEFFAALIKADLLVERQADASPPQGQKVRLSGFHVIDPKRWQALPAATLMEWRDKGWVDWVYAHLFSQMNWRLLAQRADSAVTL